MLLEAQEIKYGFRNPDAAWHTDLDWLFGRASYKQHGAPPTVSAQQYAPPDGATPDSLADAARRSPGGALPASAVRLQAALTVSPEYVNYVAALALYCARYAAVFWYTNMAFSLVFLAQLAVVSVHFSLSFCGAAVVYRLQVNAAAFPDLDLVLPPSATLAVYLLGSCCLLAAAASVFAYGAQQYGRSWAKYLERRAPGCRRKYASTRDQLGYGPHAAASLLLLLVILCRGAIVYDYVIVYRKTGFGVILACIVADAAYMISWIALWFALTLKQTWRFRLMFARYAAPPSPDGGAATPSGGVPNGGVARAGADDASGEAPSGGVLRTKRSRGSHRTQRVKFDEGSAGEIGKEVEDEMEERSEDDGVKVRNKQGQASSKANNGTVRRSQSDTMHRRRSGRADSGSEDHVTESTPENTLTRSYRHSIRDQCGLYFRMSRDAAPAPAAHSSPLPADRKSARAPAGGGEIVLDPLEAGRLRGGGGGAPRRTDPAEDGTRSPDRSPGESSTSGLPPDDSPNDSGVQLRGHPLRERPPPSRDNRHSYPMACSPDRWRYGRAPPGYPAADGSPIRHSVHLERPAAPESVRADRRLPPEAWSPDGPAARSRDPAGGDDDVAPPLPPRPSKRIPDYGRAYGSRDIKLVLKGRERDSALPSSNDASSNDSNDVLCSQV